MKKMRTKAFIMALALAATCAAKDIRTVVLTTNPQIHCANCEKTIKDFIRFEKGIKDIRTNLEDKTITIKYDADKISVEEIIRGFQKIDYEAIEVQPTPTNKE